MRLALLLFAIVIASLAGSEAARAEFNCFQTPGEGNDLPASVRVIAPK